MKTKKSQTHVEVIISFVIFIGFLLFISTFLNPFAKAEEPGYIMNNAQRAIINNITAELGKLTVIINKTTDCYNGSKVLDYGNNLIEIKDLQNPRKYTFYFGDSFNGVLSCSSYGEEGKNYTLSVYSKEKIVIYDLILELKNAYNDYDNLRRSLGINDFMFQTRNMIGEEISEASVERKIPQGIDVESRDIPIRAIKSNGQIEELILNIRVW